VTLVPSVRGSVTARRRDLILLLDTSGSMGGQPLDQSKKVCAALIDSLHEDDRLEMIEFSSSARRWQRSAVAADQNAKGKAKKWLAKLEASGGTEMVAGVMEALAPLTEEAQRQVVLLTDGYIGFETEVVRAICDKLPRGSRLHVVGVGSAVNRSLTSPTARAGRGIEVVIGIGEDAERAANRLVARTAAPLVTDVELDGDALIAAAPDRLPDLYGGCPALAAVKLSPRGGKLRVRGRTADGEWSETIQIAPLEPGEGAQAAAALFARECVEDLELKRAAGGNGGEIDPMIERLGLQFQISTRLTTWVAISSEITVDPSSPTRREIVPQELPHGVSAEGVGLRAPSLGAAAATSMMPMSPAPMGMAGAPPAARPRAAKTMMIAPKEAEEADDDMLAESPEPMDLEIAEELQRRSEEPAKGKKPAPEKKKDAPARKLRARLKLAKDGKIVLEILTDGELGWAPPAEVLVELPDGSRTMATVVVAQTTRAGRIAAGQTARLVLELERVPVKVFVAGIELEVESA
jgi:Ca-activated chloride channel homolog